jgi:hypothetical protein
MIEALQNGDDIDYEGASGSVNLNENGDATSEVYDTYTYKGGKFVVTEDLPIVAPVGGE